MVSCEVPVRSNASKAKLVLINLFICLYGYGAFVMCCPPSACRDVLVAAVKPFFNYLGLYQYFWMYAPNPPKVYTIRIYADLVFKDKTRKTWELPRLLDYKGNFYLHQSKHRYYQWKYYLFDPKSNPEILKDAALYAARMNFDPKNPPELVVLYKDTVESVAPFANDDGVLKTHDRGRDEFFFYRPKAEEL